MDSRSLVGLLARPLVVLILERLRNINLTFGRLAARIGAGRFAPRRSAVRRPVERNPRPRNKLPRGHAWLIKLVPEAAAFGSQLQFLLADPEMAALLAAAPAQLRRPIRSLCRMLAVEPPAILALPPDTRPPRPPKPRAPRQRPEKLPRVRYVFGLRYPPPLPNPA